MLFVQEVVVVIKSSSKWSFAKTDEPSFLRYRTIIISTHGLSNNHVQHSSLCFTYSYNLVKKTNCKFIMLAKLTCPLLGSDLVKQAQYKIYHTYEPFNKRVWPTGKEIPRYWTRLEVVKMDHIFKLKISPASDCSKHAQAKVWLPWEGLHDPNKMSSKELKKNPNQTKNTKQKEPLHRKKNLHHILQRKSCREEASLFINLYYFNSESLLKERKGVGGCRFSTFS